MLTSLADRCGIRSAPLHHGSGISSHWSSKANLAPMSTPCGFQCFFGSSPSGITSFPDALSLHIRNLSQYGDNQFTHAFADGAQTKHVDGDTHFQQTANHGLNVECITAQTADIVNQ